MARDARDRLIAARARCIREDVPSCTHEEAKRVAWWDFDVAYQGQREQDLRDIQLTMVPAE